MILLSLLQAYNLSQTKHLYMYIYVYVIPIYYQWMGSAEKADPILQLDGKILKWCLFLGINCFIVPATPVWDDGVSSSNANAMNSNALFNSTSF